MKFTFNNQDKNYEVEIIDRDEQGVKITVNGKTFSYGGSVKSEVPAVPQTIIPKRNLSTKEVRAVLSGTISEISIKEGDIIKAGQKLLTLSAMKMENEILAECDGRIKEVRAAQNQKVKEGEVLITLA